MQAAGKEDIGWSIEKSTAPLFHGLQVSLRSGGIWFVAGWKESSDGGPRKVLFISPGVGKRIEGDESDITRYFGGEEPRLWKHGVNNVDNVVKFTSPGDLCERINRLVDFYKFSRKTTYHPNSGEIVLDLLHPSLQAVENMDPASPFSDRFFRPFDSFRFRWAASVVGVTLLDDSESSSVEGDAIAAGGGADDDDEDVEEKIKEAYSCCWKSDTLLDQTEQGIALEAGLLECFACFVPTLKQVYKTIEHSFPINHVRLTGIGVRRRTEEKPVDFDSLLVFPKVVDFELRPSQTYAGVWHSEGIPQDRIVMSALFYPRVDDGIEGGNILFKRPLTSAEANREETNIVVDGRQDSPEVLYDKKGFRHLGTMTTEQGTMMVIPNSHVHKMLHVSNPYSSKTLIRRLVAFFVVDPSYKDEIPIIDRTKFIPMDEAIKRQAELMKERRRLKSSANGNPATFDERPAEEYYCEH